MSFKVDTTRYRCPHCGSDGFSVTTTRWMCTACGNQYSCAWGIPKLFIETNLGAQDKKLRDSFYDGLFGKFYQFMMPLIVMPVRPLAVSWPHWLIYASVVAALLGLATGFYVTFISGRWLAALVIFMVITSIAAFLNKYRYIASLLVLAVPTRLSLKRSAFTPTESFGAVHARVLDTLRGRGTKLQILDVSTGSCNSLFRHGWMTLDADYTAIDLSETMLRQGLEMMSSSNVPVDLVLGDAMHLPFQANSFDVVLSYGAVNGLSDPIRAIEQMTRVAKPGGILLFLDEQAYDGANGIERAYFDHILSSHNVIHHCPVGQMPADLVDVRVSQVYHFYYICTARKSDSAEEGAVADRRHGSPEP